MRCTQRLVPATGRTRLTAGLLLGAVSPTTASAHGLVSKQDLSIPTSRFTGGATLVLVAAFAGLAGLWSTPRLQAPISSARSATWRRGGSSRSWPC